MNLINSAQSLLAVTTTTTPSKTTGSSSTFLIVLVAVFGVLYFFVIRPSSRRRMQTMRQTTAYDVGDEVIAGGMVGRVVRIGDGEVDIDAGDGIFTFVPGAVQSRAAYNASRARTASGRAALRAGNQPRALTSSTGDHEDDNGDDDEHDTDDDNEHDTDDDNDDTGDAAPSGAEAGNWPSEGDSFGFGASGQDKA